MIHTAREMDVLAGILTYIATSITRIASEQISVIILPVEDHGAYKPHELIHLERSTGMDHPLGADPALKVRDDCAANGRIFIVLSKIESILLIIVGSVNVR